MTDIKRIAEKTKQLLTDAGAQKAQYTVTEKEKHEFNVDGLTAAFPSPPIRTRRKAPPLPTSLTTRP